MVGILYARDLLKLVGQPPDAFNLRSRMRPAFFVPETKPLSDLLHDFRLQKVHIAIVLDEYGGTAGLVTIEDVLKNWSATSATSTSRSSRRCSSRIDDHTWRPTRGSTSMS